MATQCEVLGCPDPATGKVVVQAKKEKAVWHVCGKHLACVGAVLLSTELLHP